MRRAGPVFAVVLAAWLIPASASAVLYIDINAPGGRRMPVAVPDFVVTSGDRSLARAIPAVIAGDLGMGGLFAVIPADAYLERITPKHFAGTPLSFPDWKLSGAEAVVIGNVTTREGRVIVEMRVHDATLGTMMAQKVYSGLPGQYRQIAHKFSNEILYAFTGIRGIFDTEVAFSARPGTGKGKEIFAVGIDGQGLRRITDNRSFNLFPRWSPRGEDALAYTSYRTGVAAVYIREVVRRKRGTAAGEGKVAETPAVTFGSSKSPGCFSPDGNILYFAASIDGNSDIYRVRLDWSSGSSLDWSPSVRLDSSPPERVVEGFGIEVSPSVSPDGKMIAFVSDRGGAPQVYVKTIGAAGERRVSFAGGYSTSPSWSPAGDRIAFTSLSGGSFALYTVRPDGTDQRVLASSGAGDCIDPCYSPDGRYVVYTFQKKGYSDLKIISADGRWERPLYSGMAGAGSPSWSPRR